MKFRLIDRAWEKLRSLKREKESKAVASLNSLGYTVILERNGLKKQYPHKQDKKYKAVQLFNSPLE